LSLAVPLPSPDAEPEADASPAAYASDYTNYVPVQAVAEPPSSQYHAQDDIGQYNFGFASPDQTKQEVKTADGVVRGAYSYVDANGIVQSVNYIADALGFRVAATNLPVHNVPAEAHVVAAPQAVQPAPVVAVKAEPAMTPKIDYAYLPYAQGYDYHVAPTQYVQAPVAYSPPAVQVHAAAPVIQNTQYIQYAAAPAVQAAPVVHATQYAQAPVAAHVVQAAPLVQAAPVAAPAFVGTQYHAQDGLGQYSFGFNDPNSVRQEVKTADGVVRGAYRYVDTNGIVQTVEYIADAGGFRVAGTNLPVSEVALPVPVQVTPEVAAATRAHLQAVSDASAAAAIQPEHVIYNAEPLPVAAAAPVPVAVPVPASVTFPEASAIGPRQGQVPEVAVNIPVPANFAPVSNVASIPAFESLPPVGTYSQQIYYGAAAAPATITYAQAPVAVPVVHIAPVAAAPITYVQAQVATLPVAIAAPVAVAAPSEGSQYHSQDDIGQYAYGYSDSNSAKQEVKTADGVIRGHYSYVDSDGIVQTVNYIADALGFRVGATNLPVHIVDGPATPVQAAVETYAQVATPAPIVPAYQTTGPVMTPSVNYAYLPYATNYGYNVPAAQAPLVAAAPVAASAPVATAPVYATGTPIVGTPYDASNSQYHAQDDFGQYNYGFSNPTQTKQELKTADGVTRGSYSYVDANGLVQSVNYISDAMGFRVAATNLPVHHIDAPVAQASEPVVDSVAAPVVVAAAPEPAVASAYTDNVITPQVPYAYLPYAQNYEYNAADTGYYGAAAPQSVSYYGAAAPFAASVPVALATQPEVQAVQYAQAPIVQTVPVVQAAPVAVAAPIVASPIVAAAPEGSQYHAQDAFGQYSFGYSDGNSVKQEIKTADGVVRGAYSYVDSDGIIQTVNYIADAMGFRVGATNLPVHHVDAPVVEAAAAPVAVAAEAPVAAPIVPAYNAPVIAPQVSYSYLPYATNYGYNIPAVAVDQPIAAELVVDATEPVVYAAGIPIVPSTNDAANSQYHAQDDLGQYNYGFSHPTQTKQEVKTADGVTRGSYSYVDANGLVQTVNYISDAMGFRVAATNLPVHHIEDNTVDAPVAVATPNTVISPAVQYSYLPYATNYGYDIPVGSVAAAAA